MFDHWSETHSLVIAFFVSFALGTFIFVASSYLAPSIF